jgi:hypothetical protein
LEVSAAHEIATPARIALSTMAAMPTDAHPLAFLPRRDAGTNLVDYSGHFVARDTRVLQAGPMALFHKHIAMTDPTRLHFDADLALPGHWDLSLDRFEWPPW